MKKFDVDPELKPDRFNFTGEPLIEEDIEPSEREDESKGLTPDQKKLHWENYAKTTERQELVFRKVFDSVFNEQKNEVVNMIENKDVRDAIKRLSKGGEGSGNFGHEGRPGEVGGSGDGGGTSGGDKPLGEGGGAGGDYHSNPKLTGNKVSSPNEPHIGNEHNLDRNTMQLEDTQTEMLIGNKNYIIRTELQRKGDDDKVHFNIVTQYGKRGTEDFTKTVTSWSKDNPTYEFTPAGVERQLARKFDK